MLCLQIQSVRLSAFCGLSYSFSDYTRLYNKSIAISNICSIHFHLLDAKVPCIRHISDTGDSPNWFYFVFFFKNPIDVLQISLSKIINIAGRIRITTTILMIAPRASRVQMEPIIST